MKAPARAKASGKPAGKPPSSGASRPGKSGSGKPGPGKPGPGKPARPAAKAKQVATGRRTAAPAAKPDGRTKPAIKTPTKLLAKAPVKPLAKPSSAPGKPQATVKPGARATAPVAKGVASPKAAAPAPPAKTPAKSGRTAPSAVPAAGLVQASAPPPPASRAPAAASPLAGKPEPKVVPTPVPKSPVTPIPFETLPEAASGAGPDLPPGSGGLAESHAPAPSAPAPWQPAPLSAASAPPAAAPRTEDAPVAAAPPPAAPRREGPPGLLKRTPSEPMDFHSGDHVVYPTHGVGTVQGIEAMSAAGYTLQVIVVTFEENRMTLRVPVGKAASSGLRKLATEDAMGEALETLRGRARIKRTMWSRRAQEYEAKINSGDPVAIAEVVRDLHRNAGQPDQSFSERQIYEQAMDRLAAELAAIDRTDKSAANEKLLLHLKAA